MNQECNGKCDSCSKANECTDPRKERHEEEQRLKLKMSRIKRKIAVISGKGGVGKSTVTVNLAMAFAMHGYANRVGILDADITGPCVPKMLGLHGQRLPASPAGIFPALGPLGIKVASMDFLLPSDESPVIWRGPLKMRAISQFLSDIVWGELDFLFDRSGIIVFFIMEKFLYWRHCHEEKCLVHTFAYLNLIGDGVHNFIDGMVITASFIVSHSMGIATTLAVIFHEIPQEIGDFGVLIYGGFAKWKALACNFVSALTAVAGSLVTYCLASYMQGVDVFLVSFAAGGFIYIAATDLMPELHKRSQAKESLIQLSALLTGIGLMSILKTLLA